MRYDYKCTNEKCGTTFEARHGPDDEPEFPCPVCGSETKRIISATPVHFKFETTRHRKPMKGE